MNYDFETVINRGGTLSLKWDATHQGEGLSPVIPLWVADMDFAVVPAVSEALRARAAHPVYGYTTPPGAYFKAVRAWHSHRYGRKIEPEHLLLTPTVLHAMSMALRTFTSPGDPILNMPPVYFPFFRMVALHDRASVEVPLQREGTRWSLEAKALETRLTEAFRAGTPVKALLLSNPQNPTGRVWSRDELGFLAALANEFDLMVLSDEIHADLIAPGKTHVSVYDLPELASRSVIFAGPNKTFNLAGLAISHVLVRDPVLRSKLKRTIEGDFFEQPNLMAMTAAVAAYENGGPWLDELMMVIQANLATLRVFLESWGLEACPLEATYLAWVDFSPVIGRLGFTDDRDLARYLEETGRVKMTPGSMFRTGGENHLRINLATPNLLLVTGLSRLDGALKARQTQP
jgi:cystathionine beta-lyase